MITAEELENQLADPGTLAHLQILGLGVSETRGLFKLLDLDGRDMVSIDELVLLLMRLTGSAKGLDMATIMYENKKMMMRLVAFMRFVEDAINSGPDPDHHPHS